MNHDSRWLAERCCGGVGRRYANAFRLIGVGLGVWTLAVAGCGLALGFWSLAVCRMLVGVGEASFVALASPFIGEPIRPLCPLQIV